MKRVAWISLVCLLGALLVLGIGRVSNAQPTERIVAIARITGTPDSNLSGNVVLVERQSGILPTVDITARVSGLPPNSRHGFHLHETGTCEPDFGAAGGHFDPGPFGETNPDANHPFHMGDLPNLESDETGAALLTHRTSRITLSPGPLSIFDEDGSAFIVHVDEDRGTTGVQGGAGGGRLGCGVIQQRA